MTANAMRGDRERTRAAGMNDHIARPIDVAAMFDTLSRWVRRTPDAAAEPGAAHALESLAGINTRIGRESTQGNDALYLRLLIKFRDANTGFEAQFRQARDAGDAALAQHLANDPRSTASTLGARGVERAARALEVAGDAAPSEIERLLVAVVSELAPVLEGLRRLA